MRHGHELAYGLPFECLTGHLRSKFLLRRLAGETYNNSSIEIALSRQILAACLGPFAGTLALPDIGPFQDRPHRPTLTARKEDTCYHKTYHVLTTFT
jgi:hypothetical protein